MEGKRKGKWEDMYGKDRVKYYNRNGWGIEILDELRKEWVNLEEDVIEKEKETYRGKRWKVKFLKQNIIKDIKKKWR